MANWFIKQTVQKLPNLQDPILVEGLPGIGNVGKVAADFLVEELKAVKLFDFFSHSFPHSVFVNEKNLIELPCIELYYRKFRGKRDVLFLVGDIQPTDEESCYAFCNAVLDTLAQLKGKEIITIGGIGLNETKEDPKMYCTGTSKAIVSKFRKAHQLQSGLHGVVGPIVGVTGLLLGMGQRRKMKGVSLLTETVAHPMYIDMKGAREVVKILSNELSLGISVRKLDSEIAKVEQELAKKTFGLGKVREKSALHKAQKIGKSDSNYIG